MAIHWKPLELEVELEDDMVKMSVLPKCQQNTEYILF